MKVQARIVKYENVELSGSEMVKVMLRMHRLVYDYDYTGHFIDDKKNLMRVDEYHTSHAWSEEVKIRKATSIDIEAINVLKKFTNSKKFEE